MSLRGIGFGQAGGRIFRIALTVEEELISKALDRLQKGKVLTIWQTFVLSLGSLGRRGPRRTALELPGQKGIKPLKLSGLYSTEPVDLPNQPDFNNLCAEIDTDMAPECFEPYKSHRNFQWAGSKTVIGGRVLYIFYISFYKNIIINSPGLVIPHPEITRVKFNCSL